MLQKNNQTGKLLTLGKILKFRAFNKAVGPTKNSKLINVGPTFRVLYTFLH